MKILTPGHRYALANHENKTVDGQIIQFIEKEAVTGTPDGTLGFRTVNDGTTNEEVLAMLINRLDYLFAKLPSEHTEIAIHCCEAALAALELRTKDRLARGVENTPKA